jgi:hypothetical protein
VFCGLREKGRLKVFEKNVLNGLFRPKAGKLRNSGENFVIKSFSNCNPRQVL